MSGDEVDSFNVYVAESQTAAIVSGPTSVDTYSRDYDFASGGWTKVNVGVITAAAFRGNQVVDLGGNSGRYVGIEIMTGGSADRVALAEVGITAADPSRPSLTNGTPAHLSTYVDAATNIVAQFDENILANAGNIVLTNLFGSGSVVIPVGDAQVTVSGNTLTINPTSSLASGGRYAVLIDPGAITDSAGNGYVGITGTNAWYFTIIGDPIVVSLNPENGTSVTRATSVSATFDQTMAKGAGNITITNLTDSTSVVIDVGSGEVTISGTVVTITPSGGFARPKDYAILIDNGALTNMGGAPFKGIANTSVWWFSINNMSVFRFR